MDRVVLYTTHCPKCSVLQKKLQAKKITFDIVDDVNEIQKKGFTSMPVLQVGDNKFDFYNAVKFVNGYKD